MSNDINERCLNGNWAIPILFPYWKKARLNEAYDYFNPYIIIKVLKVQVDGQILACDLSVLSKEISERSIIQIDDPAPRQKDLTQKIIPSGYILYEPMFFDIQSNILLLNRIIGRTVCKISSLWLLFPSYEEDIEDINTILKISIWSKFINQILGNNWLWPLLLNHVYQFRLTQCRWKTFDVSSIIENFLAKTFESISNTFDRRIENTIHNSILIAVDEIIQSQVSDATIVDNLIWLLNAIKSTNNEQRDIEKSLKSQLYLEYSLKKLWEDFWFKNIFILLDWKKPFDYPPEIYDSKMNLIQLDFWKVESLTSKILKSYYDWVYVILKSIVNNNFEASNSFDINLESCKRTVFWINRFVIKEIEVYDNDKSQNDKRDLIAEKSLIRAIEILNDSNFFNQNFEYKQTNKMLTITLKNIE